MHARTLPLMILCALPPLCAPLSAEVEWVEDEIDAILQQARDAGLPAMVVFLSPESPACKRAEQRVFSKPEFERAAEGWMLGRVDVTRHRSVIADYGLTALPTTGFLMSDGRLIGTYIGTRTLEDYIRAVQRAGSVRDLADLPPIDLTEAQCDELLDALFAFEIFTEVADTLAPRVEARDLPEPRQRYETIILGCAQGILGGVDAAAETLAEALPGFEVRAVPQEAARGGRLLLAFQLLPPTFATPLAIYADDDRLVGVIASASPEPAGLVEVVEQLLLLANDDLPEGFDEGAAGKLMLRAANFAEAKAWLQSGLRAAAGDEAHETDLSLALAAALIAGGEPAAAAQWVETLLATYPETERQAEALCVGALACLLSGQEERYHLIADNLYEFHKDTDWMRLAVNAKLILNALEPVVGDEDEEP